MNKEFSNRVAYSVRNHPGWLWIICILLGLFSIVAFLPPLVVHYQLEKTLKEQGDHTVKIESVTFNPFTFTLRIHSLFAQGKAGHLTWRRMAFDINVWPLRNKRIVIENFILSDASVTVHRTVGGEIIFGGVHFKPAPQKKGKPAPPFQFGFRNIDLNNVKISYSDTLIKQNILIKNAKVDKFFSWKPYEASKFELVSQIDNGVVSLSGQINPQEKKLPFSIHLEVDTLPLKWLAPILNQNGIYGLRGMLNINLIVKGKGGPTSPALNSSGYFKLTDFGSTVPSLPYTLSVSQVSYSGIAALNSGAMQFGNDLMITGVFVRDTLQKLVVVNSDSIILKKINIQKNKSIALNSARIAGLQSLAYYIPNNLQKTGPASLRFDSFTADSISAAGNFSQIAVGAALLKAFAIDIIRDKDSTLRINKQLAPLQKPKKPSAKPGPPAQLIVNRLQVDGNSSAHFQDLSTTPITVLSASAIDFKLNNFSTTGTSSPGHFTLTSKIDPFATLNAQGTLGPFYPKRNATLSGVLDQFELPLISPYLRDLFGYKITTGRLGSNTDGTVKNNKMAVTSNISINNLSVNADKSSPAYGKFSNLLYGVSLKTALSILTDRNGNVKLSIPVTGNITDPKLHIRDVITTAIYNGIKGALGSVFAGVGNLVTPGNKLTFTPIMFDPGSKTLDTKNKTHLDKVAKVLHNNSKTQINLCGKATFADTKTGSPISSLEQRALLSLANARSSAVKAYLIGQSVPSKQLFLCVPEIDTSKNAKPRVEILAGTGVVK